MSTDATELAQYGTIDLDEIDSPELWLQAGDVAQKVASYVDEACPLCSCDWVWALRHGHFEGRYLCGYKPGDKSSECGGIEAWSEM